MGACCLLPPLDSGDRTHGAKLSDKYLFPMSHLAALRRVYHNNLYSYGVMLYYCFMCTGVCLHICVCTTCVPATQGGHRKAFRYCETSTTEGCELPCTCWDSNPVPPAD